MASITTATVWSSVLPSVRMIRASSAARSGATARPRSCASRARNCSRTRFASSPAGSSPRSSIRREARSSTEASRYSLSGASGSTTVPMSRPATTIPPSAASARWRGMSAVRTSGTRATAETNPSTSCVRASSVASTPSSRTRVSAPDPSSARVTRSTSATSLGASSDTNPSRRASAVSARYSSPVSTNRSPSRAAAAAPTLLLPLEAGPSSATTSLPPAGTAGASLVGLGAGLTIGSRIQAIGRNGGKGVGDNVDQPSSMSLGALLASVRGRDLYASAGLVGDEETGIGAGRGQMRGHQHRSGGHAADSTKSKTVRQLPGRLVCRSPLP